MNDCKHENLVTEEKIILDENGNEIGILYMVVCKKCDAILSSRAKTKI